MGSRTKDQNRALFWMIIAGAIVIICVVIVVRQSNDRAAGMIAATSTTTSAPSSTDVMYYPSAEYIGIGEQLKVAVVDPEFGYYVPNSITVFTGCMSKGGDTINVIITSMEGVSYTFEIPKELVHPSQVGDTIKKYAQVDCAAGWDNTISPNANLNSLANNLTLVLTSDQYAALYE